MKRGDKVKFKNKVHFSANLYATEGTIDSFDQRAKKYTIFTKHGMCYLNREHFSKKL